MKSVSLAILALSVFGLHHAYAQPAVVQQYFPGATSGGSGWWHSSWFGWFHVSSPTTYTISHVDHGWLEVTGGSPSSIWFFDYALDWWWHSSSSIYPNIATADSGYYSYNGGSSPRWFYSFDLSVWLQDNRSNVAGYGPSYWNTNNTIRLNNNCYNYAANKRTDTFAQPGRYNGGYWPHAGQASDWITGTLTDGFEHGNASGPVPANETRIALVYGNKVVWLPALGVWFHFWDFHFYREDQNFYWTHKPGQTNATNVDTSSNTITNPENARTAVLAAYGYNGDCYDQFLGCYFSPTSTTQGSSSATID